MLNRKLNQNRLLSGVLAALAMSFLVVMASLTHAITTLVPQA